MMIWGGSDAFTQHEGVSGYFSASKVTPCLCRSLRSVLKAKYLSQPKTKPFMAGSAEWQTNSIGAGQHGGVVGDRTVH